MSGDNTRVVVMLLVGVALLCLGVVRVHLRHQVIRTGYELRQANLELRMLEEEENRLRLEESVLTNPGRIEAIARRMGMVRPGPDQLRVLRSDSPLSSNFASQVSP